MFSFLAHGVHNFTSKMTIVTGSSVLRTVWGSVLRIHSHGAVSAYTWRHCASKKKKSAFLLFVNFWPILAVFCKKNVLLQLKTFFENLSACIILVLDATFVPNLTFLDFLSLGISFEEKTVTHIDTQTGTQAPSLFRHSWTSVLRTEEK